MITSLFDIYFNGHAFLCNTYRETALAILSDEEQGLEALKCVEKEKESTPLRLLIKEMPGEKCMLL